MRNAPADTPTDRAAANIRAELARQGKSQTDLANHLGLSRPAVSFRLRGRTPIDVNELVRVAQFLGVPLERLTDGMDSQAAAAS